MLSPGRGQPPNPAGHLTRGPGFTSCPKDHAAPWGRSCFGVSRAPSICLLRGGPPSGIGGPAQAGSLPADGSASTRGVICKPPSTSACFRVKGALTAPLLPIIPVGQISGLL